jgi:hypothetical protein
MSNSKALQLVKNNMIIKINKLFQNDFYMDKEDEDDKFSFNETINNYIIFEKYTEKYKFPYYFTLEKLCDNLYLCVWFKQIHIGNIQNNLHSKHHIYVRELIEIIEKAEHSEECEGKFENECNCDVDYEYYNYNHIRQKYSLQYHKKINIYAEPIPKTTADDEKNYDINLNGLFEFVINFNFELCMNCGKIDNELSEGLCDYCLLKIDENNKEYPDECPICYDNDCLKYKVKTPCNHIFHKDCILKHLYKRIEDKSNKYDCPYCRNDIGTFLSKLEGGI